MTESTLAHYCAIVKDEQEVEQNFESKSTKPAEDLKKYKEQLASFLSQQRVSCIPVTIASKNGEERTIYLRSKSSATYKPVDETSFKKAIEKVPTVSELKEVFEELKDPQATFIDVYSSWIFNTLYDMNSKRKTTFEISESKERGSAKKNKTDPPIQVPDEVKRIVEDWADASHNLQQLKKYKTREFERLYEEKKQVEPLVDKFLSQKPPKKQEQKITLDDESGPKPYYIRRIVKKDPPLKLAITKSKPLIIQSVKRVVETTKPELLKKPFRVEECDELLRNDLLLNMLYSEFRNEFKKFREKGVKVKTKIELTDNPSKKRKVKEEPKSDGEDDGDGNDNE
jgi:hypothetical protein